MLANIEMIEEGHPCVQIAQQLQAAESATENATKERIHDHTSECIEQPRKEPVFRTLAGHSKFVDVVAFSPDGRTVASGSLDSTIKIWDLANGKELRTRRHAGAVAAVADAGALGFFVLTLDNVCHAGGQSNWTNTGQKDKCTTKLPAAAHDAYSWCGRPLQLSIACPLCAGIYRQSDVQFRFKLCVDAEPSRPSYTDNDLRGISDCSNRVDPSNGR
ncbi:metal-sensing transcriptional repressor [Bradyrhizobium sp. Pha-3]|uniref:metal-sensing transcriptional repressor n=1 Tax=Bradyrhizobium sp. Pha-3 TaxID=208375 RepID=UPI0035D4F3AD